MKENKKYSDQMAYEGRKKSSNNAALLIRKNLREHVGVKYTYFKCTLFWGGRGEFNTQGLM